ncbi:MAG: selenocysteine lyase/cysteine desulfurase [Sediminicola sp.]|jgi:selenocysteine lyase/cysteine desulfurase|tara:strand:- start:8408 stop:8557 length:150 start_codon:yes stop_codon:yes gene_type:complete
MTIAFENALATIKKYLNAYLLLEIIFSGGTNESINLAANSLEKKTHKCW